ncbi:MAG: DUF1848 domain-containing protein [Candidatus Thermoplasmatota archaeon]|nr:DUF1848 domain-containing protein [Candidatus Thermoplasmatota archaeon]
MIISASRRTDIPTHYGEWFINRLKEERVDVVNPFNRKQMRTVDLSPDNIDAIVLWTKNPAPFFPYLDHLDDNGYNYYFHYTLNNYPKIFEPHMPDLETRIGYFKTLSERIGKERIILRYDPIIISEITPIAFHRNNLEMIRDELTDHTETLVISFLDIYRKISGRIKRIEKENDVHIVDVNKERNFHYIKECCEAIDRVFGKSHIRTTSCSEPFDLSGYGIEHGSCIDAALINRLFDREVLYKKDRNQRPKCLCTQAVDIGAYNTCISNCKYCYANYSEKVIKKNYDDHDPGATSLLPIR